MIQYGANKLRGWLQSRHLPWHLAILAIVLCAPSLGLGWRFDDHFHRAALTADGRPAEAAFRLGMKLENPLFRWLRWEDGEYVPFVLPAVGETLTLPAATVSYEENPSGSETSGREPSDRESDDRAGTGLQPTASTSVHFV